MTQDKVWNYASVMDYQKIKLNKLCVCVCVCVCVMCFYTLKKCFSESYVFFCCCSKNLRSLISIYPCLLYICWRRKRQPIPVFLLGESHKQRSLAGYIVHGFARLGHDLATEPPLYICIHIYTL